MQNEYDIFIEIAGVQVLTDNFNNSNKVRKNVRELALDLLACGIDPKKLKFKASQTMKKVKEAIKIDYFKE